MKRTIITILVTLTSLVAFGQSATYEQVVDLNNGDSISFVYRDYCNIKVGDGLGDRSGAMVPNGLYERQLGQIKSQEDSIMNLYLDKVLDNPILKILDGYIADNIKRSFYFSFQGMYRQPLVPFCDGRQHESYYCEDKDGAWSMQHLVAEASHVGYPVMNEFLHRAIKIKKVREFGYNIVGDMLEAYCKIYPKDYKDNLIKQLNGCLKFVGEMAKHNYRLVDSDEEGVLDLVVDEKKNRRQAAGLEGFLIRRVIIDKVPKDEIAENIKKLVNRLMAVESRDGDCLYRLSINGELHYCERQSGGGFYMGEQPIESIMISNYNIIYYRPEKETPYYMFKDLWGRCIYIVDSTGEIIYDRRNN